MKDRIFWGVLFAGLALFVLWGRTPATTAEQDAPGEAELVAVTFASAWCSACKVLKPKVVDIMDEYAGQSVRFVELDFSFGDSAGSADVARSNGFYDAYEQMRGATGFTLLIDRDSGVVIDTLTAGQSRDVMRQAIDDALIVARADALP